MILTTSGGPFRGWAADGAQGRRPSTRRSRTPPGPGPVVTVNSASLMNKESLQLIEAHLLFDVPADDITVVVHPQSVVHSMVEFVERPQASPPDMRLPIALGLTRGPTGSTP